MTLEVEHWIEANTREGLYSLGSQPPLTLAIYGKYGRRCEEMAREWHLDCLGCMGAGRLKTKKQVPMRCRRPRLPIYHQHCLRCG